MFLLNRDLIHPSWLVPLLTSKPWWTSCLVLAALDTHHQLVCESRSKATPSRNSCFSLLSTDYILCKSSRAAHILQTKQEALEKPKDKLIQEVETLGGTPHMTWFNV